MLHACGVKADRLSSVLWKDIPQVHFTDRVILVAYRCIEEDNFNCKLQAIRNCEFVIYK